MPSSSDENSLRASVVSPVVHGPISAATIACVPHSARATTRAWGKALSPRPDPGRPKCAGTEQGARLGDRTRRRHLPRPTPPDHRLQAADEQAGDLDVLLVGPEAHREREVDDDPRRQEPVTLLDPVRRLEHLVDQRWRKHRGQYPDRDPIREAFTVRGFDLSSSWHAPDRTGKAP